MDDDFMTVPVAMRYLGIDDYDELEELVVEHDVEVEFDNDGMIAAVEGGEALKEALFERHRKAVGYRPDDEKVGRENRARIEAEKEAKRLFRAARREQLKRRVAVRKEAK